MTSFKEYFKEKILNEAEEMPFYDKKDPRQVKKVKELSHNKPTLFDLNYKIFSLGKSLTRYTFRISHNYIVKEFPWIHEFAESRGRSTTGDKSSIAIIKFIILNSPKDPDIIAKNLNDSKIGYSNWKGSKGENDKIIISCVDDLRNEFKIIFSK